MTAPDPVYSPRVYAAPLATDAQLREQKFTVAEVTKILGVSRMSVYRLVSPAAPGMKPVLRSYRIGPRKREFRIPITAVRQYLAEAQTRDAS